MSSFFPFGNVDSSLTALGISIHDLSTNKLDAVASTTGVVGGNEIYSGRANNVAYIKQLVAGAGVSISNDSSTVTISIGGSTGVQKYVNTFDGTAGTTLTVAAATHGLGVGPLSVAVYDLTDQVYTGVDNNGSGDITLNWIPGSLGSSCKYVIMG